MRVRFLASVLLASGSVMAAPAWAQDPPTAETTEATPAADADQNAAPAAPEAAASADPAAAPAAPEAAAAADPAAAPAAIAPEASPTATDAPAAMPAPTAPAAAAAPAPAIVPAETVFTGPKQIQESLGRIQGDEPVALLSNMHLNWAVRSEATATGGVFRKHKSSKEIFAPMDQAVLNRVLLTLQDDLAARFEAAGWQATTRAEMGSDVPEVKTMKTDAKLGVPVFKYNDSINESDWAMFALPGAQPVDPKGITNGMGFMRFLKGKQGVNFNITYSFAPGTVAETDSRQLGTEATGGLWFSARADLIGAKGGWGNINVVPTGLVVDPDIGKLAEISGSKTGVAENVLRYMGGMGSKDKTGYDMTPDWAKAEAAMLRAGRAFNAELVARLAK